MKNPKPILLRIMVIMMIRIMIPYQIKLIVTIQSSSWMNAILYHLLNTKLTKNTYFGKLVKTMIMIAVIITIIIMILKIVMMAIIVFILNLLVVIPLRYQTMGR